MQSSNGRNLDDVSGALAAHGGQRGFGHGDRAKEIGVELEAEFFELNIFDETRDCESGIVYQDVEAAQVAHDAVNEGGYRLEVGYIERADVDQRSDTCRGDGVIEAFAAAQVAHGG